MGSCRIGKVSGQLGKLAYHNVSFSCFCSCSPIRNSYSHHFDYSATVVLILVSLVSLLVTVSASPVFVQTCSFIRNSYSHHFDYAATVVLNECVPMPLAFNPSLGGQRWLSGRAPDS